MQKGAAGEITCGLFYDATLFWPIIAMDSEISAAKQFT